MEKIPPAARRAFRIDNIPHNLVAASELVDARYGIYLHRTGFGINYEGETLYKGWQERGSILFRMNLD